MWMLFFQLSCKCNQHKSRTLFAMAFRNRTSRSRVLLSISLFALKRQLSVLYFTMLTSNVRWKWTATTEPLKLLPWWWYIVFKWKIVHSKETHSHELELLLNMEWNTWKHFYDNTGTIVVSRPSDFFHYTVPIITI